MTLDFDKNNSSFVTIHRIQLMTNTSTHKFGIREKVRIFYYVSSRLPRNRILFTENQNGVVWDGRLMSSNHYP